MNVVAVVVTYNRKFLLKECLDSILNQTKEVNKIILIDNNSDDGTDEFLKENGMLENAKIVYRKLEKNIGGAGGFHEGIKDSLKYNPDWVWVMDDDTIPLQDCLENLLEPIDYIEEKIAYLASTVYGPNNEPMNVPKIDMNMCENGYDYWYKYLKNGIITIQRATFVSLLINKNAIEQFGLPVKDFFIWGDDTEYTIRLKRRYGKGFFVGKSKAIHKRNITKALSILEEDDCDRINMYYYFVRNLFIYTRAYWGIKSVIRSIFKWQKRSLIILRSKNKYKIRKFLIIHKAIFSYIFRRYDREGFKNRFMI